MTFALKDFLKLRKDFIDTLYIIIERDLDIKSKFVTDEKDKSKTELGYLEGHVRKLQDPRKSELLFLCASFREISHRALGLTTHHQLKPFVNMFYGAMLVVAKHIERKQNYFDSNGLLHQRLMLIMDINEKNKLDAHQSTIFYKAFNDGLTPLIFDKKDSREGILAEHALDERCIPLIDLQELVSIGYELEQNEKNAANASMKVIGKTITHVSDFKLAKEVPDRAVSNMKFDDLNSSFKRLINSELADKNKPSLDKLSAQRSFQLNFLKTLASYLTKSDLNNKDKVAILTGAMFLVRGMISIEYKALPLSTKDIKDSKVHTDLTALIAAKERSFEDIDSCVNAFSELMHFLTVEPAVEKEKECFRVEHPFNKVTGFHAASIMKLTDEMLHTCRKGALDRCVGKIVDDRKAIKDAERAAAKAAAPRSSMLGGITGLFKHKPNKTDLDSEFAASVPGAPTATATAPTPAPK